MKKKLGNGLLAVFPDEIAATYSSKEVIILEVKDNSMEPKIPDGSFVGVDTTERKPVEGMIFAIRTQEACVIRRLLLQKGAMHFVPEHPSPTNRPFYFRKPLENPIIGRVIWSLNLFREDF